MPSKPRTRPVGHPRYAIVRKLGRGGTSTVYLARDRVEDGREVALKVCHGRVAPEQILREFRILRELRHGGVARAFDFGRLPGGGQTYFTMEYVAGPDLEKQSAVLRKQLTPAAVGPLLDIFLEVIEALDYLHRRQLLHLDVKPSNMVLSEGGVKLIDFGLFEGVQTELRRPRGTIYYVSPEVLDGRTVDERADLYALGVSLYRCFTGRYPIPGNSLSEIAARHRTMAPRPPRGVPEQLSRVILKLLAKSPRHRFGSAREVHAALASLGDSGRQARRRDVRAEPDFVGRKRELASFFKWLDDLESRRGCSVLLIEGEAGIGKSRFVDKCVTELLGLGVRLVSSSAFVGAGESGLRLVVEKVDAIQRLSRTHKKRYRFLLTYLGLAAHAPSRREIRHLTPEQIRSRVFRELMQLCSDCARPNLVLVLEDLERADDELLAFVQGACGPGADLESSAALGIIGTVRVVGDKRNALVDSAHDVETIRLKGLSRPELLRGTKQFESVLPAKLISQLVTRSNGSPGLLAQLVNRSLASDVPSPPSESDLIGLLRARLDELRNGAREIMVVLALMRTRVSEALLRDLAGLSRASFDESRRRLQHMGLLRGTGAGFYIDQDLLGRDALEKLVEGTEKEIHARVGLRLLNEQGLQQQAAHHLLRGGQRRLGLASARQAAEQLRDSGRVDEALAVLTDSLPFVRSRPLRRTFLEEIGDLHQRNGQFDLAAESYDLLLGSGDLPDRERPRLLRKRGGIHQRAGDSEAALAVFEEALRRLEAVDDFEEHLYLLNELAAHSLFQGDFSKSTACANRGLEMLNSSRGRRLRAENRAQHGLNLHSVAGHIFLRQFEYDRAVEQLSRALELAESLGDPPNTALILNNLGVAYYQANRLQESLRVYRRAKSLAETMGDDTSLFSILCNVAGIRARLGELRAAGDLLEEVESMPAVQRSTRARLFFLHTKGLVARLARSDVRAVWEECVKLAVRLPDPLFASYGRLYLFENEVLQGRWSAARALLGRFDKGSADRTLERAFDVRRAWFEALTGHDEEANSLLGGKPLEEIVSRQSERRPRYSDLWDGVCAAETLLEIGRLDEAGELLRRVKRHFDRFRQPPGMLECALLGAELDLRRRQPDRAVESLDAARKALALHDSSEGSRAVKIRLPFLEARAGMQSEGTGPTYVTDRLVDAAGNIPYGSTIETEWLIELVRSQHREPGADRRLTAARDRFVKGLAAADRRRYLSRDHELRLAINPPERGPPSIASQPSSAPRYLDALIRLRAAPDPASALRVIVKACGGRRGALFYDDSNVAPVVHGFDRVGRRTLQDLREAALRSRAGAVGSGWCAEIRPSRTRRLGVFYVEFSRGKSQVLANRSLVGFLDVAGQLLGEVTGVPPHPRSRRRKESTPFLVQESIETETLLATSLMHTSSPRMREVLALVERTRDSRLPVLLIGESGVGKDRLARWIHSIGPCHDGPFVGQDCAAIPEALVEAELFGHEAGAFTDARLAQGGYLLAAERGSFYLDNVDSLPLETQAKLLRVIESKEVRPVGSKDTTRIHVRFMASSQRDLKELCDRGGFRSDLFFRLAGIPLRIPSLRERVEDIPPLVSHFLQQVPATDLHLNDDALDLLRSYSWPGNIRELESLVRRLALTHEGTVDDVAIAGALGLRESHSGFPHWLFEGKKYDALLKEVKREYLLYLFDRFRGDMESIARELGTSKRTAYLRFSQAGLRTGDLRARNRHGS